eukprot:tig00021617_g22953.t1
MPKRMSTSGAHEDGEGRRQSFDLDLNDEKPKDSPRHRATITVDQDVSIAHVLRDPYIGGPLLILALALLSQTRYVGLGEYMGFENGAGFNAILLTLTSGISTGIGGLIVVLWPGVGRREVAASMAFAGGVMIYLAFVEMMPEALAEVGHLKANGAMFAGMGLIAVLVTVLPDPDVHLDASADEVRRHMLRIGYHTAIGLAAHNMPEGVAVFMACLRGQRTGLLLMLAMALHNVPEGVAVAMPIYAATGSRWLALRFSLISGLVEPVSAVAVGFGFSRFLTPSAVKARPAPPRPAPRAPPRRAQGPTHIGIPLIQALRPSAYRLGSGHT